MVQSLKHLTFGFCLGRDLGIMRSDQAYRLALLSGVGLNSLPFIPPPLKYALSNK